MEKETKYIVSAEYGEQKIENIIFAYLLEKVREEIQKKCA